MASVQERETARSSEHYLLGALGAYVRERRRTLGLTQAQLGERLGWAQERISLLENGKYGLPSLPLLARLASALETSLAPILDAVGYPIADSGSPGAVEVGADQPMNAALYYMLQQLLAIDALDLKDALNQASDQIAQAMGAHKVDAFMYDPSTESLIALGTSNTPMGKKQHQVGLERLPRANRGRTVEVFESGEMYFTGHADQDPGVTVGMVEALGVRSLLVVPLFIGGEIRGVLSAASEQPDQFSDEERSFFEAAARWVSLVARRAELSEAITRQSAEDARHLAAEEIITTLAHDLGNQLTPIKGRIDLMLRRAHRHQDERQLGDISEVARAVQRIQRMIDDLLDVARLDHGLFALSFQPTDLVVIAGQTVEELRAIRETIELRAPDELVVEVDPTRIGHALHNVVSNAILHTPDGTPVVIEALTEQREDGEWAVLRVHDQGPGIPSDALPTLFRPYASGPGSSGLGLGLYLARSILEAHGGSLTVDSTVGCGTTFHLALPVAISVR
jgi:two-component system OmpR family sensor kinase